VKAARFAAFAEPRLTKNFNFFFYFFIFLFFIYLFIPDALDNIGNKRHPRGLCVQGAAPVSAARSRPPPFPR
jgi:hypothetical protein